MSSRELSPAIKTVQLAGAAIPTDLEGVRPALGDLHELLDALSSYSRQLSSVVEMLSDGPVDLRVDHIHGAVSPEVVFNHVANHLQAAAAGIDQARTAVGIARLLSGQLHTQSN